MSSHWLTTLSPLFWLAVAITLVLVLQISLKALLKNATNLVDCVLLISIRHDHTMVLCSLKKKTHDKQSFREGGEVRAWFQWKRILFMRFFLWRREEGLWISFTLPGSVLPVIVKDLSAWHVHKVNLHPTAMKTSITVFYVNRNKVTLKCFGISFLPQRGK